MDTEINFRHVKLEMTISTLSKISNKIKDDSGLETDARGLVHVADTAMMQGKAVTYV